MMTFGTCFIASIAASQAAKPAAAIRQYQEITSAYGFDHAGVSCAKNSHPSPHRQ